MPIISSFAPDRNLMELIEKVRSFGAGLGVKEDTVAYLASDITANATTFSVDDASKFSAGWLEIDLEMIRIKSVDLQANTITLAPAGRGYRGTVAAQHSAGAEVLFKPIMARSVVAREINREIAGLYPTLAGIDTLDITTGSPTVMAYGIPADADAVVDVRRKDPLGNWVRVRSWETEFSVNTDDFPTGAAVVLGEPLPLGTAVQVVFSRRPRLLTGLNDAFSGTGLPDGAADVVELGAIVRLLPAFDIGRLSNLTVSENEAQSLRLQGTSGGSITTRELKAQYAARLDAEQRAFAKKYPPRLHRVS